MASTPVQIKLTSGQTGLTLALYPVGSDQRTISGSWAVIGIN